MLAVGDDSFGSGFANSGKSLKQPGFSPINVDFLRLLFLAYLGNAEFKLGKVGAVGSATSRLNNIIDAILVL